MAQRYRKAADTFVAMLDDGSQRFVTKGETLPENHELVAQMLKRDQEGADAVWRLLDPGETEAPKSEPEAAAPAPVKAAPAKEPAKAAAPARSAAPAKGPAGG